jgi:hypothetical protein
MFQIAALMAALALQDQSVEFTYARRRLSELAEARSILIGDCPELDEALRKAEARVLKLISTMKRPR